MGLDTRARLRYAYARVFTAAVWWAYGRKLAQPTPSLEPAPLWAGEFCTRECEVVGGKLDCTCTGWTPCEVPTTHETYEGARAPFTGTPYDPDSMED